MSLLLRRSLPLRPASCCRRTLSTTAPRAISLQLDRNDPEAVADTVPAYPYGPARWYKQSNLGLYGGQRIRFGNNVGPKSGVKTRRAWRPNIFRKRLYSRALRRYVQVRVSARVLRTIDKLGGLDEYLLGEKEARIRELGMSGWWLRWAIMQTGAVKRRFRDQREGLGLPRKGIEPLITEMQATEQGEAQVTPDEEDSWTAEEELAAGARAVSEYDGIECSPEDFKELDVGNDEPSLALMEPVGAIDDAFQVEHKPELPPLKFRVGPRAHLVLTSTGWQRTKPNEEPYVKQKAREDEKIHNAVDDRFAQVQDAFDEVVNELATSSGVDLSEKEKEKLLKKLRNDIMEEEVEARWQRRVARVKSDKHNRRRAMRARSMKKRGTTVQKFQEAAKAARRAKHKAWRATKKSRSKVDTEAQVAVTA